MEGNYYAKYFWLFLRWKGFGLLGLRILADFEELDRKTVVSGQESGKNSQRQEQKQIPYGNDKQSRTGKGRAEGVRERMATHAIREFPPMR